MLAYLAIVLLAILWLAVACENKGVEDALNPGTLDTWVTHDASTGLGDNFIWTIFEDSRGNIWAGTGEAGVRMYDGISWSSYTTSDGLLSDAVLAVGEDLEGDMWFGTGGGLNFLIDGEVWYNPNFEGITITALYNDSRNRMWMGTYGSGIYVYDDGSFYPAYFTDNDGYNYINSIMEDKDGFIWFGTDSAALYFNGVDFYIVDTTAGLYSTDIMFIYQDSWDYLWFCTFYGEFLSRYDGSRFEKIYLYHGKVLAGTFTMTEDLDNNLWFATVGGGIMKSNGIQMIPMELPASHRDESFNCSITDRNGNLWFGGFRHGILVYISP